MTDIWRCLVTDNPVGTDTQMIGRGCSCQVCRLHAQLSDCTSAREAETINCRSFMKRAERWEERATAAEAALAEARPVLDICLLVLCAVRDGQTWSSNMLKDIDCAIDGIRALKDSTKETRHD